MAMSFFNRACAAKRAAGSWRLQQQGATAAVSITSASGRRWMTTAELEDAVKLDLDGNGFATVTFNRPKQFNTFSDKIIGRCSSVFRQLRDTEGIRATFVRAEGKFFSAGADLQWMKSTAAYTEEENIADAVKLGEMLLLFNSLPMPTIAVVQGPAFGGGVGLISCCDVAIGVKTSHFTLSEVKLGILPATISPYVVARIGAAQARRYFLTAETISADKALDIGLLHEVVDSAEELEEKAASLKTQLGKLSPTGMSASKRIINVVDGKDITSDLIRQTAESLATQRASAEGQEGLTAFFEKRKASWVID